MEEIEEPYVQPYTQTEELERCYNTVPNEDKIFAKANSVIESGHSKAFYILDLDSVRQRCALW